MRRAEKRIGIAAIILHPSYDATSLINDIALVRLMDLALFNKFVSPTCIWQESTIPKNREFQGFGVGPPTSYIYPFDKSLYKNRNLLFFLIVVDNLECNAAYVNKNTSISSNQICSGQRGAYLVPGSCEVFIQFLL